jgi:hypothetical protein
MTPGQVQMAQRIAAKARLDAATKRMEAGRQAAQRALAERVRTGFLHPTQKALAAAAEVKAEVQRRMAGRIGWEARTWDQPQANGKGGVIVATVIGDKPRGTSVSVHVDAAGNVRLGAEGPHASVTEAIIRARGA